MDSLRLGRRPRPPNPRLVPPLPQPSPRSVLRLRPPSSEHHQPLAHSLNQLPNRLLSAMEGPHFRITPAETRSLALRPMLTHPSRLSDSRQPIQRLRSLPLALRNHPYLVSPLLGLLLRRPNLYSVLPPPRQHNLRSVFLLQQRNPRSALLPLPLLQRPNPRSVLRLQPQSLEHLLDLVRSLSQLLTQHLLSAVADQCSQIPPVEMRLRATRLMPTRPSRHLDSRRQMHSPPLVRRRLYSDSQPSDSPPHLPSATLLSSRPLPLATQRSSRPPRPAAQHSSQPLPSVT